MLCRRSPHPPSPNQLPQTVEKCRSPRACQAAGDGWLGGHGLGRSFRPKVANRTIIKAKLMSNWRWEVCINAACAVCA